jgi:hypothetical protein
VVLKNKHSAVKRFRIKKEEGCPVKRTAFFISILLLRTGNCIQWIITARYR